jgi:putative endonuclease
MDKRQWVVYLIRCFDESLYCGITNNLKNRLAAHISGKGAKYTRSRRPVKLVGVSSEMTKSDALKLEYRVKQVPSSKKIYELTKGENEMTKNLKKNLQAINREIKVLAKKVDQMIVAVGKLEKIKTTKAKPAKKSTIKKPAKLTAADTILGVIKRSKKGVDVVTLMKKTGFNKRKIYDNVKVLKKRGKIKNAGIGVYVRA